MSLPNGVNHLAICTKDMKTQLEFFTQVIGLELTALFWMPGGDRKMFHAFLKLNSCSYLSFVASPEIGEIQSQSGVSNPEWTGGAVAPGVMQHVAFNVDSARDLLTLRDRIRSHGHWVMGPVQHRMGQSIYLAAPENVMIEFSTTAFDQNETDMWFDPAVVRLCGITLDELERMKSPPGFQSRDGTVPNPAVDKANPPIRYPGRMARVYEMTDEEVFAQLSASSQVTSRIGD